MQVILDSDVAELYGVETRDINKAVKNNPDKFPDAFIFELDADELDDLATNESETTIELNFMCLNSNTPSKRRKNEP